MTRDKDPKQLGNAGTKDLDATYFDSLPNSHEAEKAILGGIILNNELIAQAMRLLTLNDFYTPSFRIVYSAMMHLAEARIEINPIMIAEVLKRSKSLETVGGISVITNLTFGLPGSNNLIHYINVVRAHSRSRWLIKFAVAIQTRVLEGTDHPDEVAKWVIEQVDNTTPLLGDIRRPKTLDELYDDYALRLMLFHKGVTNAIPTGFQEIDSKLLGGGMIPSFTYVLAGRPSMGKSTLALDICANASDSGYRSVYVTREMPRASLMDRMVAAKSGIPRFSISSGMSLSDYELALETVSSMRLVPMILDDSSETVEEIDYFLTSMEKQDKRVDLLGIDYLQLMAGTVKDGRTNEVSGISRGLKGIAMRHDIPVIEVSQLTRAPGKEHRAPELFDLRESGQIEQDADFVGFLHGDEPEEGVNFYQREFICRKQREGPLFHRLLDFNAELVTFRTPEMLGHGEPKQMPGRVTVRKDTRIREKKTIQQEARALELEAKDRAADKLEF